MRRALLLCLGILAVTWLQFRFFPGHTYLQSDTQIYLPILERLDTPGYLSRDLIATHPHVSYTIYDEVTLFLHGAGRISFERALTAQQLIFRAAGVLGVFLIVQTTGISDLFAFVLAALVNFGATLSGPAVLLVEYEAVPRAFAFGLMVLAIGLFAQRKPLLAAFAGALAFLYHAPTVLPFWLLVLAIALFEPKARARLRPSIIVLVIAILLLANLAQLQPGVVEPQPLFGRISQQLANIQQYRTQYAWVSSWASREMWHYLVLWVCSVWATTRIWGSLNAQLRWFFVIFPLAGILSVPLSYLLVERMRFAAAPEIQPARALLLVVLIASMSCGIAGFLAAKKRRFFEAWLWFIPVFILPASVRVLDAFRLADTNHARQFLSALVLSAALALSARWRPLAMLVPVAALFGFPTIAGVVNFPVMDTSPAHELADWAEKSTWGSSMFLFPDVGRQLSPGIFRAESRRALWTDWKSGGQANYFESVGLEWWTRWKQTMDGPFTTQRLSGMLSLPIDYYVLNHSHRLRRIKPVFENKQYLVYDAEDLRNSSTSLRIGTED